ncbi:hypothetical protein E4U42_003590, partial [Claviceps africana]
MNLSLPCLRCQALRLRTRPRPRRPLGSVTTRTLTANKRPSIAPKPIVDIKAIRQDPELYERTCTQRNYTPQAGYPARIIQLHSHWQQLQKKGRSLRERANLLRKVLANPATSSGDEDTTPIRAMSREEVQHEARQVKAQLASIEEGEAEA